MKLNQSVFSVNDITLKHGRNEITEEYLTVYSCVGSCRAQSSIFQSRAFKHQDSVCVASKASELSVKYDNQVRIKDNTSFLRF